MISNVLRSLSINIPLIIIKLLKDFEDSKYEFLSWRALCFATEDSDGESTKQKDLFESRCIEILEEVIIKNDNTNAIPSRSQTFSGGGPASGTITRMDSAAKSAMNSSNFLDYHESAPIFYSLDRCLDKNIGPATAGALCKMIESSLEKGLEHKGVIIDILMNRFKTLPGESKLVILKAFNNFSKNEAFLQTFIEVKELLTDFFHKDCQLEGCIQGD